MQHDFSSEESREESNKESAAMVELRVDGRALRVAAGSSVAAVLAGMAPLRTRTALGGTPRFALCGMGVCQECRIVVDGQPHVLACRTRCRDGMVIVTGGPAQ